MDFESLLQSEIQDFIEKKTNESIAKLALSKNPFPKVDFKIILNQIECRAKSEKKLSTWFNTKNILYPSKISIEQTSSEITANYKSQLVNGNSLIDLTGGFGVDTYYFSKKIKKVSYCEMNTELAEIVAHNCKELQVENINFYWGDSQTILKEINQNFDWIYIDPSRRNDKKGKVFMLADCSPNVPELLDFYFQFTNSILIKTAPLLDISAGLKELTHVSEVHIISVDNDVKELLWIIKKNKLQPVQIKTMDFSKTGAVHFDFEHESSVTCDYSLPLNYLYEPNSALMKSGGFNDIGVQFEVTKLHSNSHLYTSNELKEFPGRVFEINKVIDYSKKSIKENIENTKANITTRNFTETVESIKKKWKIRDGGEQYYFFTTNLNNDKIVLLCTKIKSE